MRTLLLIAVHALLAALAAAAPDLVFVNARVWTADEAQPGATAFAVRDGRFEAVGDDDAIRALAASGTRVIDLEGARVVPGLMDAHIHLGNGAVSLRDLDLRPATSRDDLLRMVAETAAKLPQGAWLFARGWSSESWPDTRIPNADEIDRAAGGRPALLVRMDGHMLVAGRSALNAANITADGPSDPAGGKISRDDEGVPDGALYDEAMTLLDDVLPDVGADESVALMRETLRLLNQNGITQVGAIEDRWWISEILLPFDEAGELTLRVRAIVSENEPAARGWIQLQKWALSMRSASPRVQVVGFKGYMDGSLGSRTAWMHQPYLDDPRDPENCGFPLSLAGSRALQQLIEHGAKIGVQPWVHAIGDRANTVLLDWYAAIPAEIRRDLRPRIEHAQHLTSLDIQRIAELGVVASMQPFHKADDGRYAEQRIGAERCRTSYAFRDLLDRGAHLAFGSDWPVVSCSPFLGIEAAVTARTLDGRTFVPEQSITVEEALHAYTTGAAFALGTEDRTGMIRPGYLADFVVLDRDILAIPLEEVGETTVSETWLEGERVWPRK